jgi:hypothetical protein
MRGKAGAGLSITRPSAPRDTGVPAPASTFLPAFMEPARDHLRRVLIHDQDDRDAIASQLLRYREGRGDDWADIIDLLTMYPKAWQKLNPRDVQ